MRILLCLITSLAIAACSPGGERGIADYRSLGELRVATRVDAISYIPAGGDSDGEPERGGASGFEHDLIEELARELGVPVRYVVYPGAMQALNALLQGEVHLAAAGLARNERLPLSWSSPLRELDYVLAGRSDSAPVWEEEDLDGRTVTARRGSLAAQTIAEVRKRTPAMEMKFPMQQSEYGLLRQLAQGQHDLVATDRAQFALASQVFPELEIKYQLPLSSNIAWALPMRPQGDLATRVELFLARSAKNDLLTRIADRYFLHVHRITRTDTSAFLARIDRRLPALRMHFQDAQVETGIDWRYLAALSYQESHWDPLARSRTGVRGIMMLTIETADQLGVTNRLDTRASILGGARYLAMLRNTLANEVAEPDRMWMATAAYNLGMGHMNGARAIARALRKDDRSWWDMKSVLPLLSRPEYAARLKSGRARGGEAVIMTENVRNYFGILTRIEPPYLPPPADTGTSLQATAE